MSSENDQIFEIVQFGKLFYFHFTIWKINTFKICKIIKYLCCSNKFF